MPELPLGDVGRSSPCGTVGSIDVVCTRKKEPMSDPSAQPAHAECSTSILALPEVVRQLLAGQFEISARSPRWPAERAATFYAALEVGAPGGTIVVWADGSTRRVLAGAEVLGALRLLVPDLAAPAALFRDLGSDAPCYVPAPGGASLPLTQTLDTLSFLRATADLADSAQVERANRVASRLMQATFVVHIIRSCPRAALEVMLAHMAPELAGDDSLLAEVTASGS